MIALAADCILLRRESGEFEPVNAGTISIEVITEGESPFDEDFVKEGGRSRIRHAWRVRRSSREGSQRFYT